MPHSPCSFVLLFEYQIWHVVTALQVCEALAAQYAATSSQSPPEPPKEYLCPISQQIMINPVLLVETGDSYEAANITRWLDTHSTCPLTGQQRQSKQLSKQLSSNRALKNLIADWAAAHGFVLPAAPTYTPVLSGSISPATTAAVHFTDAAACNLPTVAWFCVRRSSSAGIGYTMMVQHQLVLMLMLAHNLQCGLMV